MIRALTGSVIHMCEAKAKKGEQPSRPSGQGSVRLRPLCFSCSASTRLRDCTAMSWSLVIHFRIKIACSCTCLHIHGTRHVLQLARHFGQFCSRFRQLERQVLRLSANSTRESNPASHEPSPALRSLTLHALLP